MRAGVYAVAAADAFAAVRSHGGIDVHLAGVGAGFAAGAPALIKMHAVQGDLIEEAVDRAEGADVFAERAVDDEARGKYQAEDDELEAEKAPELACDLFVQGGEPEAGDCAGRADVLAEERGQFKAEREQQYEDCEHRVFEIAQVFVELEFIFLEKRDLVQKVLQKAERAEEAADCAADQGADEDQDAGDIVGQFEFQAAEITLQGTYRAGADRAGAGVAVESRNANGLSGALVDLSFEESLEVGVLQERCNGLDRMTHPFLSQFRHTPYRSSLPWTGLNEAA